MRYYTTVTLHNSYEHENLLLLFLNLHINGKYNPFQHVAIIGQDSIVIILQYM